MELRILGPLEAVHEGRPIELGGRARELLALLALHANETVSVERLTDALWEGGDAAAVKALRVQVSRLRKALPDGFVATRPGGYALEIDAERVDARRFERLVADARGAPLARAEALLEQALALWRGAPEAPGDAVVARLAGLRAEAVEALVDAKLARGRHAEVVGRLEAAIADDPYRERLRAQLMLALYRCGRQADALQAYRDAHAVLAGDLGIEPGAELRALERAILAHDGALAPPPVMRVAAATPFVARERELERLRGGWAAVRDGACVAFVVSGEAGIGKSRLAAELARHVGAEGGTVLVGRCEATPASQPFAGEPVEGFLERLRAAAPALLVLEDLQWAGAATLALLREVLRAAPRVLIVATHRAPAPSLMAELRRDGPVVRLALEGLDEHAVGSLARAAGVTLPGFGARLREATGGNPFFVRELLAHYAETGELSAPDAVHDVVAERVARLPEPVRHALAVAAAAGPEFSPAEIEPVAADAIDALDTALTAGLVVERAPGRYAFTHALVRDAIYTGMTTARRARLHRLLGEALERDGEERPPGEPRAGGGEESPEGGGDESPEVGDRPPAESSDRAGGGDGERLGRLAYHFACAVPDGQAAKATDYALAAGRAAVERGRHEEAAAHYERALAALGPRDPGRRELARALRRTRYEPLPDPGGLPAWLWRRLPRAGRVALVAAPVAIAALAVVLIPGIERGKDARERADAARVARADAADLAQVRAIQRPHVVHGGAAGTDARARGRLLASAAASVRADAAGEHAVLRVECHPYPSAGDPTAPRARYECLAVTTEIPATARSPAGAQGLQYRLLIDYRSGDYGYCRLAPRAVKIQREPVGLSPECGGAEIAGGAR